MQTELLVKKKYLYSRIKQMETMSVNRFHLLFGGESNF